MLKSTKVTKPRVRFHIQSVSPRAAFAKRGQPRTERSLALPHRRRYLAHQSTPSLMGPSILSPPALVPLAKTASPTLCNGRKSFRSLSKGGGQTEGVGEAHSPRLDQPPGHKGGRTQGQMGHSGGKVRLSLASLA
ncbi:unnamed protein product [Bursaphelenchus xylophilus]|uniref:(pine wood nematode) hypothetical protein n=1 Tax=Bursaphelenchus xylophilus TaxID=6326 RepID=A0A1I7S712_BURXY|nr:unnamed protein product [Bursaphelenchus xylophilus]CAG9079444.1 unnamed protein product [Bursaphelenchus xylophilus]